MTKNKEILLLDYLKTSKIWKDGLKHFTVALGKPQVWLNQQSAHSSPKLISRRVCSLYSNDGSFQGTCPQFIADYCNIAFQQKKLSKFTVFRCCKNKRCAFITAFAGNKKVCIVFCNLSGSINSLKERLNLFVPFFESEVDSWQKLNDLRNLYETVHPRAIALSSMHSVNRVISSSPSVDDLIPKIGRLCSQIVKAKICAIYLLDNKRKWLVPRFVIGSDGSKAVNRRFACGKGLLGGVCSRGDFYITKSCVALPLIDDDVIGVLFVKNKVNRQYFSRSDIEVLKALSEQAVIALRNTQLMEDKESLTQGSINAISKILDINLPQAKSDTEFFTLLASELSKHMGLSHEEVLLIKRAASLVDAGHLGIPESILHKKGNLTKREFDLIKTHPYRSAEILRAMPSLKPIVPIILYHHERFDGTGYPKGLKGDKIPLGARILSIVVAFSAMITNRTYKETKSIDEAIAEIKKMSGSQFDPVVSGHFIDMLKSERILNILRSNLYGAKSRNKT